MEPTRDTTQPDGCRTWVGQAQPVSKGRARNVFKLHLRFSSSVQHAKQHGGANITMRGMCTQSRKIHTMQRHRAKQTLQAQKQPSYRVAGRRPRMGCSESMCSEGAANELIYMFRSATPQLEDEPSVASHWGLASHRAKELAPGGVHSNHYALLNMHLLLFTSSYWSKTHALRSLVIDGVVSLEHRQPKNLKSVYDEWPQAV